MRRTSVPVELEASARQMRSLEGAAIDLAREWVDASARVAPDASAARLAGLLRDRDGLAFTVAFIDTVVRPEDVKVAARALRRLARQPPEFLSAPLAAGLRIAGIAAPILPRIVVPAARRVVRELVRHLVVAVRPQGLGSAISAIKRANGGSVRLNMNLLGEAILGDAEAERRLAGTLALINRDDVDYVSIKVSATVAPHSPWAFDHAVGRAVAALRPLYVAAKDSPGGPTFINLDMEEYRDLALTVRVFTTLLDDPELHEVSAGIALQAYLPDALAVMADLQEWAARRVASGGAPVKVRVVKGANLPMERVDADAHGWPVATWGSKVQTDANFKAVLGYALQPERVANVRVGVAGQNLFDIALAWELAGARGVRDGMDVEMLLGMAPQQMAAVRDTVGQVILYTPTVRPTEFDVAIAYLVRRLEEGAASENFMSAVFDLAETEQFEREADRFRASLRQIPVTVPGLHRVQDRSHPSATRRSSAESGAPFDNAPDSDPAVPANIAWADHIRSRMRTSTLGTQLAESAWIPDAAALDKVMARAARAGAAWARTSAAKRAAVLRRAAEVLEARRADFIEVAGAECGKTVDQTDPEVSEAVDFARYYARSAEALERVDGAAFVPVTVTVVTPPWNFPVAIPAGGVLAALASGSAVVLKPAGEAARCSAVLAEALWEAGVPRDALQYVRLAERTLGERLIAHPRADQVILTGAYETAELFRAFRPDLRLFAETSGKNAIIVTPRADLDLAARDVAYSAFGHAGQKCSAASLVVLVGSVARSARFRRQLLDAVGSYVVGPPHDAASQVGPLIGPPGGKLRRALTELDAGESWLIEPRSLDSSDALWSPGIKAGVTRGSDFHLTEYFGPVLGIMEAASLDEAIATVNQIDYGLTSGLHSLDANEITTWLERVEAGNLYVNRGTTGAIVGRQPFGGWKRSSVGTGTKAGGPHYVAGLGHWKDAAPAGLPGTDGLEARVVAAAKGAKVGLAQRNWLAAALGTDERAWAARYGIVADTAGLEYEQNLTRYQAVPVTVRLGERAPLEHSLRVLGAGIRAGGNLFVSHAAPLPESVARLLAEEGVAHSREDGAEWAARAMALARDGGRVRLVGEPPGATTDATGGSPAVAIHDGDVVSAGDVELLPFLREQAVSITAHRFGMRRTYRVGTLAPAAHRAPR